jgi:hypothetical protein
MSVEERMNLSPIRVASLLLLGMFLPVCQAQDKPKTEDKPKAEVVATTPVKVQIVFTEFEGEKKVKSLPYTMYLNAPDAPEVRPPWVRMRIGSRVPVYTGGDKGSMTYLDVGTNIDARSGYTAEGRLLINLNLERSWVEGDVPVPVTKSDTTRSESDTGHFREPIIRNFRSELDLKLREGQSIESTMATDPLSAKVFKVEVSFTIVK